MKTRLSHPSIIAVTPGDPDGIGPEVVWKTIKKMRLPRPWRLLCVGAKKPFEKLRAPVFEASLNDILSGNYPRTQSPHVWLLPAPESSVKFLPGFQAGWSIQAATQLTLQGVSAALVTGPISKERLQQGGFIYSGHTDFLADLCGKPQVTMMLANSQLKVSLVTTHLSLSSVSQKLSRELIQTHASQTIRHLREWWGLKKPRVAIAALNPHAGEGGLFGREEIEIISPAIHALQKEWGNRCFLEGPLPADTLFAKHILAKKALRYDAVLCMYHDQGLIPVKLLDFPNTVNVTLGLPIIRTSVDHGTGFDIAGKNKADPSSLQSAIQMALDILKKRKLS